jgi:hypothetical protein
MRSALDMFSPCADRLPPDAKRVLATLFDDVTQLADDAWKAAADELPKSYQPPADDPDKVMSVMREINAHWVRLRAGARKLLRHAVPALTALSDQDLNVVISVGREAMIARKHGLDPTDTAVLLRRIYAAAVDALAFAFLYYKFGKTNPTTPLAEVLSADELKLTDADPAAPVGDVLPRDALIQACRDACDRAAELLVILDVELEMRIGRDLGPKPAVENVVARYFEILCGTISTHASTRRGADFSGREFKTPRDAEIRRFLSPSGSPSIAPLTPDNLKSGFWLLPAYGDLTPSEVIDFKMVLQMHWSWCRRAESPNQR